MSFHCLWVLNAAESRDLFAYLYVSETSGSYATGSFCASNINSTGNAFASATSDKIIGVTDTTNIKVRFTTSVSDDSASTAGASSYNRTHFSILRLGDT